MAYRPIRVGERLDHLSKSVESLIPQTLLLDEILLAEAGGPAVAGSKSYRIYSMGPHPHVREANLGMRADTY